MTGSGSVGIDGNNYGIASTTTIFGAGFEPVDGARINPATVYQAVDLTRFAGREWLTERFDRFRARHRSGFFLVESAAGLGKTTFAAWISRERGYVSHLSEPSGPNTAAVVRRDLAAQLIPRWHLEGWAPEGMLPPASARPDWFAEILTAAARSRDELEPGTPIVLVIDGVDAVRNLDPEAGVGLPRTLPEGVYVLATARVGSRLYEHWSPFGFAVIHADDEANLRDMEIYLRRVADEREMRDRLAAAGMLSTELVGTLKSRCAGVWIYLHFVLDEIRSGRRRVDDLGSLPEDLWSYYAQSLERLRRDEPSWDLCYLPVLAVLAVAREPVPLDLVVELCPTARRSPIRRFLGETFQPFCHITPADPRTREPDRFQLYHASLRDFLLGERPEHPRPGNDAFCGELRDAAQRAHELIIDRYLSAWGGLRRGLPELAARPAPGLIDRGYGLRHIVEHLRLAGWHREIHRLLGCVRVGEDPDGRPVRQQLWFAIRDHADDHDGYLNDVELARGLALHTVGRKGDDRADLVGLSVQYSLILAGFNSLAESVSARFATVLVNAGIWSTSQALSHARRLPKAVDRARAYLFLLPQLDAAQRTAARRAALAAAAMIRDDLQQAELFIALAPHLDAAVIERDAIPFVCRHSRSGCRVVTLDALLAALPPERRPVVAGDLLEHANQTSDADARRDLLIGIAPHLPVAKALSAGDLAWGMGDSLSRAVMAVALSAHLPDERERAEIAVAAITAARTLRDPAKATNTLLQLAPRTTEDTLPALADGAFRLSDEPGWSLVAQRSGQQLGARGVEQLMATMFPVAGSPEWVAALENLAPRLEPESLHRLVGDAAGLPPVARARMMESLAPVLPESLYGLAVEAARGVADPQIRMVLEHGGSRPPDDEALRAIRAAFAATRTLNDDAARSQCAAALWEVSGRIGPRGLSLFDDVAGWLPDASDEMALGTRTEALRRLQAEARNIGLLGPAAVRAAIAAVEQVAEWFP
ncbi:hypothetical protein [Dactylosporangium sp. CA-139066]|uniref:hypothetical protein n=1 Tax=Dactylosporangium sp. CA-139066 TaxID=3239930 RepID=UPI003D8B8CC6